MVLPNQLTVARIILTPVFLFLFISGNPMLIQISLIVFLIAALTDWYDGWLARKFNYITDWGKFMDPLADKILTSTAFFALVSVGVLELWMVFLIVLRDVIVTVMRIIADSKKISFSTSLTAKIKTFIQMIFLYYVLIFFTLNTVEQIKINYSGVISFLLNEKLIYYSMLFVTVFTVFTGIQYFVDNRLLIKKMFSSEN